MRHRRRSRVRKALSSPTQRPIGSKRWRPAGYPPVAHDVSPPRPPLLLVAPTACRGSIGTPAGHGSGEWHPRRSRVLACCVDAFAAEQGLRDAEQSSLTVLDMYSPVAEVPSPNQAHDLI